MQPGEALIATSVVSTETAGAALAVSPEPVMGDTIRMIRGMARSTRQAMLKAGECPVVSKNSV